jgi:phage gp29-like protein
MTHVFGTKQKPPEGELGRAVGSHLLAQWRTAPYSPDELLTSKGWSIYDRMQTDAQVKAALWTKKYAVLCKPWHVAPASESEQDKKVAEFVNYALLRVRGEIGQVLYDSLDALAKGYSIAEKNWEIIEDDPTWKGYWTIKNIKSKDPANFTFDVDDYLNVNRLLLTVDGIGINQESLPVDKFIIYSYNPTYGQPWGQSDLRAAYRHWWCKDFIIKWWQLFTEKYAMPTLVGYYKSGTPKKKQEELLNILDKISSDTAIVIPEEVSEQIKEIFTQKDPRIMYESAVAYHDTGIAKAILGETLTLDSPGRGSSASFAMAKVHQDTLTYQLTRIKQDLEGIVVSEQIVKQLVSYNFGNVALPKFFFEPLTEADIETLGNVIWKLTQVGIVAPDEQWVRDKLGWPHKEEGVKSLPEMQLEAKERASEDIARRQSNGDNTKP